MADRQPGRRIVQAQVVELSVQSEGVALGLAVNDVDREALCALLYELLYEHIELRFHVQHPTTPTPEPVAPHDGCTVCIAHGPNVCPADKHPQRGPSIVITEDDWTLLERLRTNDYGSDRNHARAIAQWRQDVTADLRGKLERAERERDDLLTSLQAERESHASGWHRAVNERNAATARATEAERLLRVCTKAEGKIRGGPKPPMHDDVWALFHAMDAARKHLSTLPGSKETPDAQG